MTFVSLPQLPSAEQVAELSGELRSRAELPRHVTRALAELPPGTHPMTQLSIAVLALQVLGQTLCRTALIRQRWNKHPPSYMSFVVCVMVAQERRQQLVSRRGTSILRLTCPLWSVCDMVAQERRQQLVSRRATVSAGEIHNHRQHAHEADGATGLGALPTTLGTA